MKLAAIIIFCLAVPAIGFSATLLVPSQHPTIQGAINVAANGDTVLVAPGTYVENIDFVGKAITVTSEKGADVTIIDGNQNNSVVIFQSGEGVDAVLDGFTLTNGSGNLSGGYTRGGAIYCVDASSPTIMNNIITKNSAYNGGGIYPRFSSSPKIENNLIFRNSASYGGGILCHTSASPVIEGNIISENTANQEGGGMLCNISCSITFKNNTVTGNSAFVFGGGIEFANDCSLTIENNVITNNSAKTGCGGGITVGHNCTGTIANNIIAWNSSNETGVDWCGGGIALGNNCSLTISNNLIYCNSATRGGGIDVYLDSNVIISNNTIIGNSAGMNGGGIACRNKSSVTITDTILWDNKASSGPEILVGSQAFPSTLTISYSDLKGGQASVQNNGSTLIWGPGMIDADPLLAAGPSGFHYLGQTAAGQPANSPCVDTGSDLASNLGMDVYWTRTDEVIDSGTVDMGYHYGDFLFPWLQADTFAIPESAGGEANFLLLAGAENANRTYILLGGISGTDPGTPLPGGEATLPLNWDFFTNVILQYVNSPIFHDFMGTLDIKGSGTAQLNIGPVPGGAQIIMHFAYALNGPWNFVSNPVAVEIVP